MSEAPADLIQRSFAWGGHAARARRLAARVRPSVRTRGVRPIHIFGLRVVYALMFFVLGRQTWTHILTRREAWDPTDAVAWCVWTAFATLAGLGIVRPLRMLPILLLEIFYKVLWLVLVAYPLWRRGTLSGSPAEQTASAFAWVLLPIAAVPWGYVFVHYVYDPKRRRAAVGTTAQPDDGGETWQTEG